MKGFFKEGKKEGIIKGEGLGDWTGSYMEAIYVRNQKEGQATIKLVNP